MAAPAVTLEDIRDQLPDAARDLRLNLGTVLTGPGAPGLSANQIWSVALACALASRNGRFAGQIDALARPQLTVAEHQAAHAAAAIMSMNNVYDRFLHRVGDPEYRQLPARLRMNVIAAPGIERSDFELLALAVSAINGCGLCIETHERQLRRHGRSREQIQSAVRIAATVYAVAGVLQALPVTAEPGAEPERAVA